MAGGNAGDVPAAVRDPARLQAVRDTGMLDTPPEECFDRLTRLAAKVTRAPVTFISLVDETRDFYKSSFGFSEPLASARELSGLTFCHFTVGGHEALVIPDTRADPVYREVPTVDSLGVAAYLGIPLTDKDGRTIGSFCAIDFEPHAWTETDVEIVRELADSTMREIELRRAVAQAEAATRQARAAARARDEVVAIVSHDLRNPLHTIQSAASLLSEDWVSGEQSARLVASIRRSAGGMNRLIEDLLDVSRIESGRFRIEPAPVDLAALIANACESARTRADGRQIDLSWSVADGTDALQGDAGRLGQVLDNLIGNALKFTPPGGRVRVEAERRGVAVRITVSDSGPGIAPEAQPHIFDRFRQASNSARSGAGLGLAIVKGIVAAHAGDVFVESAPGTGTRIGFTLPVADRDALAGTAP